MSKKKITPVGLIGCGTVAQYGHLPAITKTRALSLVAVADLDRTAREKVSKHYGADGYEDYRDLLARRDIQAVSVCTRVATHYEIVAAALRAGKHVFCEKPFADTPRRCQRLVELARQRRRLLAVNF